VETTNGRYGTWCLTLLLLVFMEDPLWKIWFARWGPLFTIGKHSIYWDLPKNLPKKKRCSMRFIRWLMIAKCNLVNSWVDWGCNGGEQKNPHIWGSSHCTKLYIYMYVYREQYHFFESYANLWVLYHRIWWLIYPTSHLDTQWYKNGPRR